jgi:hypothetical protein
VISRLGVDFGRVIHGGLAAPGEEDTAFLNGEWDEAMASPATPGMWEVLPQIVDLFGIQVWVISKCGARVQERTLNWLDLHDFYAKTGSRQATCAFVASVRTSEESAKSWESLTWWTTA